MTTIKALTVDFDLIAQSMRDFSRETSDYYLDKSSGKVVVLSRMLIRSLVEDRFEEVTSLPEWDAQMIPIAREIVLGSAPKYIRIPEAFGLPEHRWMAQFTETLPSLKLKHRMHEALRGRGGCKRFKSVLKEHPDVDKSWQAFRNQSWKSLIQNWLESAGILAVEEKRGRSVAA